jgi:integrase
VHAPDCAGGLPLAAATVRQVHSILHRALDQAVRWGWITRNPASLASPPRLTPREVRPPRPEQVAALLNAAWAHVDVGARELLIERNLVQRGRQRKEKATKTHQTRRIALDQATMAILAEHRQRCQQRAPAARTSLRAAELLGQYLNRPGQVQPDQDETPQQRAGSD